MTEFRVRFIAEKGFISSAILEVTNSQWSHVDIVLPDNTYLGARSDGGVQVRPVDYVKDKDLVRERRYAIPIEEAALDKALAFAHAQVGKTYDFEAIAGLALHTNWDNTKTWFCSELACATAFAGGLNMLNVQDGYARLVTPEMLHLSPLLINGCYYSA